jgi:hypothetical protein
MAQDPMRLDRYLLKPARAMEHINLTVEAELPDGQRFYVTLPRINADDAESYRDQITSMVVDAHCSVEDTYEA